MISTETESWLSDEVASVGSKYPVYTLPDGFGKYLKSQLSAEYTTACMVASIDRNPEIDHLRSQAVKAAMSTALDHWLLAGTQSQVRNVSLSPLLPCFTRAFFVGEIPIWNVLKAKTCTISECWKV